MRGPCKPRTPRLSKNGKPLGRPPEPVPAFAETLIEWVSKGQTIQSWVDMYGSSRLAIDEWRNKDPEFSARYAHARRVGFDAMADALLQISDEASSHPDDVNHRKLRIWTRLQLLAKWDPRRYGDKLEVAADPTTYKVIGDTERMARLDALLDRVLKRGGKKKSEEESE